MEDENSSNKPKIVGLTGGIGSGKTTVANFIEGMGFPVYYSDVRAKEIVNEDHDLRANIQSLLGAESYNEDGLYNRKFVASKVFEDDILLKRLNELIHPAVKKDFEDWIAKQTQEFLFKETALLFELRLNESCYKSILVTADDNLRKKRVMDRDQKTYREVEAIMQNQMPEKDKIRLADYVIYNNDDFEKLKIETEKTVEELISE